MQAIKTDTRGQWFWHEQVYELVRRLEGQVVPESSSASSKDARTTRCALGLIPEFSDGFKFQFRVKTQMKRGVQLLAAMLSASVRLTQPIRKDGLDSMERRNLLAEAWVSMRVRAS